LGQSNVRIASSAPDVGHDRLVSVSGGFDRPASEVDFGKLHFGRKVYGQILFSKLWTTFHPKPTDKNSSRNYILM
jgi:hypothetical protein